MEYTEIYRDQAVFWKHTQDPEHKIVSAFFRAFTPTSFKVRKTYGYGDFSTMEFVIKACETVDGKFPNEYRKGFIFNENVNFDLKVDPVLCNLLVVLKKKKAANGLNDAKGNLIEGLEILEAISERTNNNTMTFSIHVPEPVTTPNQIEVIASYISNDAMLMHFEGSKDKFSELSDITQKSIMDIYGGKLQDGGHKDECVEKINNLGIAEVAYKLTDLGYVLHPLIETLKSSD